MPDKFLTSSVVGISSRRVVECLASVTDGRRVDHNARAIHEEKFSLLQNKLLCSTASGRKMEVELEGLIDRPCRSDACMHHHRIRSLLCHKGQSCLSSHGVSTYISLGITNNN
uniref:Uncharacterized protein n=1 Tax=Manihot esculenta TaxID=3983 RepID=A0A251LTI7_MANES